MPGLANLITTFGITPWPRTLSLARVHVAPNQKLCSVLHAVESAKECFKLDGNMELPYYYLTPVSTEALYILSDVGLQSKDDVTRVIGVAAMRVNPADNTVDLAASEGPTSTLMACRLLHLEDFSVLVPPQLSCPAWTRMRRATIWYESFIHFIAPYAPPDKSEVDIAMHQLGSIQNLVIPEPAVLLSLANQLENLKAMPAEPTEAITEPREEEGTKEETLKKTKSVETDPPRKHHKSREDKSQLRHSPTEKSPASSSHEYNATLDTDKLGDVVAQACLSVARMSRVVEKAHNSNTSQVWLVRQCLEKASIEAIDSMKDEIQGTRTSADMWRVEKKIGAQVSSARVKAYHDLAQHHDSVSDDLMRQGGSSTGSSEIAEAEENFCKSVSNLVSTVITEGAKVSGERGAVLISSVLCLVPNFPLSPVLTPTIDLPTGMECRIILGDAPQSISAGQHIVSSLPSSPLTGGVGTPTVAGSSTIRFGQAVTQPAAFTQPGYPFFKQPASTPISTPQKGCRTPYPRNSPLLKESSASPEDLAKSSAALPVVIDVADDDEASVPVKSRSSNVKGTDEGSKQRESPPAKKVWTEDLEAQKSKPRTVSRTSRDERGRCDGSKKGPDYKQMRYLTFEPISELEMVIFKKCSFDQPPLLHPSPLRASDKLSPSSKTTYSETTRWLQQSQKNVDHFWKKDTALVKALRQYHLASGALEGQTQWKFQKSRILHKVLDVIALNMESTERCLDFHDSTPMDQEFRHQDMNLRHLKAVAVKEVEHLTMVLVLDEDHTHYSDAFGNIFESGALSKKRFPKGSDSIKMKKGGPAEVIVCHFCPHMCSNDDYAYRHLAAIHLNI